MIACRLLAKSARIRISIASTRVKSSASSGRASSASTHARPHQPAGGARRPKRLLQQNAAPRRGGFGAAEQAPGADHEDDRHGEEHDDEAELGHEEDAEGLQLADDDAGEQRTADAAHAADHGDDEGGGDDVEVHQQVGAALGELDRTREAGECRTDEEDRGREPGLVDAQGTHHLAVGGGGPDQDAPAGPAQQQPEEAEDQGCGRDQHEVVGRQAAVGDGDGTAQRPRAGTVLGSPDPQGGVLDDEDDAEGGEELEQLGCLVDAAQDQDLDRGADEADQEGGAEHRDRRSPAGRGRRARPGRGPDRRPA